VSCKGVTYVAVCLHTCPQYHVHALFRLDLGSIAGKLRRFIVNVIDNPDMRDTGTGDKSGTSNCHYGRLMGIRLVMWVRYGKEPRDG